MKRWILFLTAALCVVVLLLGCGVQNFSDVRPAGTVQNVGKSTSDATQVDLIVPDQKAQKEVPAQQLNDEEPAEEEAPAAEAAEGTPAVEAAEEVVAAVAEETMVAEVAEAEETVAAEVAEIAEETAAVEAAEAEAAEEPEPAEAAEPAVEADPEAAEEPVTEPASADFLKITGLDEVEQSLEAGETIVGITYTEGLGESADWFYTTDPWEIQDLWTALQMIETDGASKWFATDWYPSVEIYLSDLSVYRVAFNGHWLDTPDNNYRLKNDEMFWTLTTLLKERYKEAAMEDEDLFYVPNSVDLYFPANPTTGYSWTVEVEDEDIIAVEEQYFEDSHAVGMTGVGGTQWFHFDGLKEGNTSVKISYQRPWEENEPLYVFLYRLSVDEGNNVMIWGFEMNPETSY